MPEMTFTVRWPDGRVQECYSPSLVVHDHLSVGGRYTVADFAARASRAMGIASERVREKYGFACTSAAATTAQVERAAAAYDADALVEVLRLHPPLPGASAAGVSTGSTGGVSRGSTGGAGSTGEVSSGRAGATGGGAR